MRRLTAVLCFLFIALPNLARGAAPQWIEARSPHFTVISDANDKQARHILDQLERMRWVFAALYPKADVDSENPILVFAAKNGKTFQSVEPEAYLAKGQLTLAGLFLQGEFRNYILLRLDTEQEEHPFATIYHEYTHLQFSGSGEWMPLWLNEGIAQFFQNTQIQNKNVLVGQPDVNSILFLRQHSLIPLPILLKVDATSPYYHQEDKGSIFYAESWALTHYLQVSDRTQGTNGLHEYIHLISQHEDSLAAAEKSFGDLKQLQSSLQAYIQQGQYRQFVLNSAAAPIDESSYSVNPVTQLQADNVRAQILTGVQREKDARELIDSILKADPQNSSAHKTLGLLELHAGNKEAALKLFEQAVKQDPKDYLANYYYARTAIENGHADPDTIETCLRAAIQSSPNFAPAYERLASYLSMHHKNMVEAFSLIKTAIKLDPGNFYYRLNASSILANLGKYDDAEAVAGAAVKLAKSHEQAAQAQSQIDQFKQFQAELTAIEKQRLEHTTQQPQQPTHNEYKVVAVSGTQKHPAEANGPKHSLLGTIHGVTCGYPATLELRIEAAGKTVNLYSNDFSKINLTALGFTPKASVNPCVDLDGVKARVQYAEAADKSVDGQVFAIEMRK